MLIGKTQDLFAQQHQWILTKMQEYICEVNAMFEAERGRGQKCYKEYEMAVTSDIIPKMVILHHRFLFCGMMLPCLLHGIVENESSSRKTK